MRGRLFMVVLVGLTAAGALRAGDRATPGSASPFVAPAPQLPVESMPDGVRDKVKGVLDKATLTARSATETFNTDHTVYRYLLDNPNHAVKLWRKLGAKVTDMEHRGGGIYLWTDGQGSELTWQVVHRSEGLHAWYAEGKLKPTVLLPAQPFRAVVVMQYTAGMDVRGQPAVRHQVHFNLLCEGRAISLATRVLGSTAP